MFGRDVQDAHARPWFGSFLLQYFLARSHRSGVEKISLFTSDFSLFLILIFEAELKVSKIVTYYDQLR